MPGVSIVATSVPRLPFVPPAAFGASGAACVSFAFGAAVCVARFGGVAFAFGVGVAIFGAAVTGLGSGGLGAAGVGARRTPPAVRSGAGAAASMDTRIIVGAGIGFDVREKKTAAMSAPCNNTEAT